ncbi:MBL fold metallo-hydrolase [Sulfurospirillum barnesii]|uniref:Metal-dependent hydrolase, beta-lactamase superfamily II n=1 Tax=Sulfurospirillum barnesii (strain ATCC 700032 / DSM 10660 / SES-3) TaxID=760154 RepID=I3XUB7_SULBS|nr:MBL fold metallo-hydrolase [Sulfurospirillum barnesii]AFL67541.1 metal-dependent hydrolase, beta-lactamase superfamily II [Sulfurospirillum barnesii SES-3]
MELKVLVDNNTIIDRYFLAEPAVSYLISEGDTKVLFDVGYSDIFIKNAQKMNESLKDIDYVVISHGHNDHTGGLISLATFYAEAKAENIPYSHPTLIAHPEAFLHKEESGQCIGSMLDQKNVSKYFKTQWSSKPLWITPKLVFLGEIERTNAFENLEPMGQYETADAMKDDYVKDDSALVYQSAQGLVIITGCSHSGICNIIEYAKKVCKDERIVDIIGGFHLLHPSAIQAEGTLKYFHEQQIKTMHPCHCTSLEYKIKLSKTSEVLDVGVGLSLMYE